MFLLKKWLKIIALILISLYLFAGCISNNEYENKHNQDNTKENSQDSIITNSPTIKTRDQILEDLKKRNECNDRVYDEIKINKRQTQEDKLLDIIFVTIKCHTDKIEIVESYKLTYGLYNEGWMLDTAELDWNHENSTRAISHPGTETIDILMEEYNNNDTQKLHDTDGHRHYHYKYDSYEVIETTFSEEEQTATTTLRAFVFKDFATIIDTIVFEEFYDDGWCILGSITDSIVNSELDYTPSVGKYMMYHFDEPSGITFEIEELNVNNQIIKIKCQYYDLTSDGLVLVDWDGTYDLTVDPYFESNITGQYCNHHVRFECDIGDWWSMRISPNFIKIYRGSNYQFELKDKI